MSELKPCPFCGSENVMIDDILDNGTNTVFCGDCQSKSSNFCEYDAAAEQWNTRATQSEWISVDDRLPFDGQEVIACREDKVMACVFTIDYDGHIYFESKDNVHGIDAVYWMPLPTPPKEK